MILSIIKWPSTTLKVVSGNVSLEGPERFPGLIDDMKETMVALGGVGLSAIQVGVPLRIVVTAFPGIEVLVNPTIELYREPTIQEVEAAAVAQGKMKKQPYGELVMVREGCLSLPGIFEEVRRWNRVVVRFQRIEATGLFSADSRSEVVVDGVAAQCVQHELEHLDGKFFLDHVSSGRRDQIRSQMRKR